MLAILGSRNEEIRRLREHLVADPQRTYAGIAFWPGKINDAAVVLADIGSDTIRAAAATQIAIDRLGVGEVISVGSAQPLVPYLQEGDLVVGKRLWQFDPGRVSRNEDTVDLFDDESIISSDYGLIRRLEDAYKGLFAGQSSRPQMIAGTVISDNKRAFGKNTMSYLHRRFGAVALDRTGAAMAEVCCINDVSLVVLRTIAEVHSDTKAGEGMQKIPTGQEHAENLIGELLAAESPARAAGVPIQGTLS
jgi:adenosylhomocysteine nucleosidase